MKLFFNLFFNWRTMQISHNYTYIISFLSLPPLTPSHPFKSSQSVWLCSMHYIATSHHLCISEKAMAPHSSPLAWKIPWMEEPGRLQSMGSRRVGLDWATSLSLFTFMHWRRKWQPTPVFLPGESQGWGAWWAAVSGVAPSWTRLKRLSSSSSIVTPSGSVSH